MRPLTSSFAVALASTSLALGCGSIGPTECTDPNTAGCVVAAAAERVESAAVPAADVAQLTSDNTAFAIDLYQELATQPGNLIFSPFGISEAVAMTYAGARGNTATQIATALHFSLPSDRFHPAFDGLDLALGKRSSGLGGDGQLDIANALWGQLHGTFEAPFLKTLAQDYGTGVHVVDFAGAPEPSRALINTWVSDRTHGKIADLLPPNAIDAMTRFVITNAVYFKASWQTKFDPSSTSSRPFTRADGTQVQVPTMVNTPVPAAIAQTADYDAVQLPYVGGQLGAVFILPKADLATFEASITGASLGAILAGLSSTTITISLPKFDFKSTFALKDPLSQLGMTDAFTSPPVPDFSGISGRRDLFISAVLHQATVTVDESGTVAAAATAVVGETNAVAYVPSFSFDHPFLFAIRDLPTGTILFLGRIADPSATSAQ